MKAEQKGRDSGSKETVAEGLVLDKALHEGLTLRGIVRKLLKVREKMGEGRWGRGDGGEKMGERRWGRGDGT